MNQEDINDLLHKELGKITDEELPVCKTCGEKFLGYPTDKFCLVCEVGTDNEQDK